MSICLGPALIDPDGGRHDLSEREFGLIVSMAASMGIEAVSPTRQPSDAVITTGQAAEILGVSRRTVTRMLDRGELPGIRLGLNHHRSVKLADVLAFKNQGAMGADATG